LEDDTDIARWCNITWKRRVFEARLFHTPTNLIPDAERRPPALFLLDIMVPAAMASMSAAACATTPGFPPFPSSSSLRAPAKTIAFSALS